MYYVYFIESQKDYSVYVGCTEDLVRRFKEHCEGKTKSLKSKLPLKLLYYEAYHTKALARKREIQLKRNWKAKEEVLLRLKTK